VYRYSSIIESYPIRYEIATNKNVANNVMDIIVPPIVIEVFPSGLI